MPHPSHSVQYKALEQVSKNDLLKKFRPITDKKLYKWTYKKDAGTQKTGIWSLHKSICLMNS